MEFAAKISPTEIKRNPTIKTGVAEIRSLIERLKKHMQSEEVKTSIREAHRTIAMLR
jgi:hypothetical protein